MLARIGVLKALHRGVVREFNPDRKDTHWGKAEAEAGSMIPRQQRALLLISAGL
jgi:hypothetical protein